MFFLCERFMGVTLVLIGLAYLKNGVPEDYIQVTPVIDPQARLNYRAARMVLPFLVTRFLNLDGAMESLGMPPLTLSGIAQVVFWLTLIYFNASAHYQWNHLDERNKELNAMHDIYFYMALNSSLGCQYDFSIYNVMVSISTAVFYYGMSKTIVLTDTAMQDADVFDQLSLTTAPDMFARLTLWVAFALNLRTNLAWSYAFMTSSFYIACALKRHRSLPEEVRRGKKAIFPYIL